MRLIFALAKPPADGRGRGLPANYGMPDRIWVEAGIELPEGAAITRAWAPDRGEFEVPARLVFAPSGHAALSRLLKSQAACEVMQKRYRSYPSQRIGLLVAPEALLAAKQHLTESESRREANRVRAGKRRDQREAEYRAAFQEETLRLYPRIPARDLAQVVARATEVSSGRVGRSQKALLAQKVQLALWAHVRHSYTDYDEKVLEFGGGQSGRRLARELVRGPIEEILASWEGSGAR